MAELSLRPRVGDGVCVCVCVCVCVLGCVYCFPPSWCMSVVAELCESKCGFLKTLSSRRHRENKNQLVNVSCDARRWLKYQAV